MRTGRPRALTLALTLVLTLTVVAGSGCLRFDDTGTRSNVDDYDGPRGHPVTGTLRAEGAVLSGLDVGGDADGAVIVLGDLVTSVVGERVLVLQGADVTGAGTGVLFVFPGNGTVRLDGELRYGADRVTLTGDALLHGIRTVDGGKHAFMASETLSEKMDEAGLGDESFFSDALDVTFTETVVVHAERLVLVTEDGATNLTSPVDVTAVAVVATTAHADVHHEPRVADLTVAGGRGMLAVENATGTLDVDGGERRVDYDGHGAVALAGGSTVRFSPAGGMAEAVVDGRAFQVYARGEAVLPARLVLSFKDEAVTLQPEQPREAKFTLENPDPHTDAVISGVDVTGVPEDGDFRIPRFVLLTEVALREFGDNPVGLLAVTLASPALVLADVVLFVLDALFGPPDVPQVMEAGTTLTTAANVAKDGGPFQVTLSFEGNFDRTSDTLTVE